MPAARFSVLSDVCIRIEWSVTDPPRFVDEPSLLSPRRPRPRRMTVVDSSVGAPPVEIRTPRIHLRFRPDGRPFHTGNLHAVIKLGAESGRRVAFWHAGDRNCQNLGGTVETLDGVRGPVPIGEGLLARDGWHVLDDSHGHLLVDDWVAARSWRGVPNSNIDWYLFGYGTDYAAALRAFAHVAGRVPAPRRAMLGSWYSRYWPHTSAEFRAIVADYCRHGIPLDVMVMDMDWHSASTRDGWTGWSWNRDLLPDAEGLLNWLHAEGLQVALNLHPADGVAPGEDRYAAFMRAQGADPATGERLRFDAGNLAYMRALFDEVLAPLEECARERREEVRGHWDAPAACQGVDLWWVDWQQDRYVPSVPGLTNLAWLNELFFQHAARGGRRGALLSRWGGMHTGDHRHPLHFSGDAHTGWAMLAFQVPFTVAAGNAGCFFWSHDIGGHFGPRLEECTARWCWFGALSAALRLHSARTESLDRRPWTYAEPFAAAMRRAFELRATLMPTIDAAAHECEEQSLPLLRPMYLANPGQERAYRTHGQYLLGGDLLAAPVVSPGFGPRHVATVPVWFPPGHAWHNWFTHERFEGDSDACIAAAIDEVPLFAPAGVPVLTRPFSHRPAAAPIGHFVVRLYPGEPGTEHTRELYEDDGDSVAYRRGERRRTPVTARWLENGRLELRIGPAQGTFAGAIASRRVSVCIGAADVANVSVNGRAHAPAHRDGLACIDIDASPVESALLVEADVAPWPADRQRTHDAAQRRHRLATLESCTDPAAIAVRLAAAHAIGLWPETDAHAGVGRHTAIRLCDPFGVIDNAAATIELRDTLGPETVGTASHTVKLRAGHALLPLEADQLPEPPIGLRATRTAHAAFTIGGEQRNLTAEIESRTTPIASFVVNGPHPWDWRASIEDQRFAPELHPLDPAALSTWTPAHRGDRWPVDLRRTLHTARGLAYAATVIRSDAAQSSRLHLDGGDRIEAWLNGEKVFTLNDHASQAALTSTVPVRLRAGDNLLLIKTNDGGGGWGFAATLDGERPVTVPPLGDLSARPA